MGKAKRLSRLEVLEGTYVGAIVSGLIELGVWDSLRKPSSPSSLAAKHKISGDLLSALLRYVFTRSQLIKRHGEQFVRGSDEYRRQTEDCVLGLYLRAYGPNLKHVADVLQNPQLADSFVDRVSYSNAFVSLGRPGLPEVSEILSQLNVDKVLDVGCGPASLLMCLAQRRRRFKGWGLEANQKMCEAAKSRIKEASLDRRISIIHGDDFGVLPARVVRQVQTIVACSLLNEFFADHDRKAIEWLCRARKAFHGRTLIVADYYGELDLVKNNSTRREALLHDIVQAISGQGIPPSSLELWNEIYEAAGCTLLHVCHYECPRFRRFLHFVSLQRRRK